MERVQQVYKVTLLDDEYELTPQEFTQFQRECREIAGYGVDLAQGEGWTGKVIYRGGHAIDLRDEPEINAEPIEAAEMIKPMDTKALKVRIDKMEPHNARKDIKPYIKMHEAGKDMIAIKNQMLDDKFCAEGSLEHFTKKVLAASTKVTKIVDYAGKTDDQIIEELKQKNKDRVEDRQKPRASKG